MVNNNHNGSFLKNGDRISREISFTRPNGKGAVQLSKSFSQPDNWKVLDIGEFRMIVVVVLHRY